MAASRLTTLAPRFAAAGPGERDFTIGDTVLKIGSLIGGGEIDEAEALDRLLDAVMFNGGDFAEQKEKIERAVATGKQKPKSVSQNSEDTVGASVDDRAAKVFALAASLKANGAT